LKQARQWRGRSVFIYPVLAILTFVMIALGGPFVTANGQTGNVERAPAAVMLQQDGIYDFRDQVIRCQPGEEVGIWAETSVSVSIANVVIEGCSTGIMVTGSSTTETTLGATTQGAKQTWSAHVQGVRMRVTTIGIFLSGSRSTATRNIVGGAKYGIVVTGDDNTLVENQSNDNLQDGFLITGDRNLLEGNEARRNGGVGIHVARTVPMVGDHRFLSFIQDRAANNVIRGNTALDNKKRDLEEFADCERPPFPPLRNEWTNNTFETRQPDCIQQLDTGLEN
jgi:Periplasmic copper-binding protein (NosD)